MFDWLDPKTDIDFMGYRRYFVGASLMLALAAVVAFIKPGPRFGTDFVGGTEVEVAFNQPIDGGQIRAAVEKQGFHSPDVIAIESDDHPHQFLVRVKEVSTMTPEQEQAILAQLCLVADDGSVRDEVACPQNMRLSNVKFSPGGDKVTLRFMDNVCGTPTPDVSCPPRDDVKALLMGNIAGVERRSGLNNPVVQNARDNKVEFFFKSKGDQIMDGLRAAYPEATPEQPLRVEWIGPKAGKQLRDAAIKSITIAVIMIMLYIAFRFDMRFAPGAIAALVHDVFLAIGAMVLVQHEITLSTVAALLTIVGYSINDTVVVYDRIRENLGRYRKMSFPKVINRSITEMLGRTIKTSSSTALAVIPFLFWGTGVIKDFAFTLLVGVIVGTYSSIYVAAPLTEFIDRKIFGKAIKKKKRRLKRKGKTEGSEAPAV